ncbi:hypothetical protein F7725_019194 [Dissostichus mawsoni]|uniref:Gap junction protein n=1 Tax=Dissostichus mawsoni TaxID=36200 RepID=A0A7J5YJ52_DISMA|nr:hypothetical protein F7725_019194 [Dissostichus mawsoni]
MAEWTILERLLEAAVQQHSTMIGRILLTVVVIFRILIVAIVGETVYTTSSPCSCATPYSRAATRPATTRHSHLPHQIIIVCCPSLCFITYSVHQSAKQKERRFSTVFLSLDREMDYLKRDDSKKMKNTIVNGILQNSDNCSKEVESNSMSKEYPCSSQKRTTSQNCDGRRASPGSTSSRLGLVGQYFLYGFNVPGVYECDRYPCIKDVECYVSRPTEKTVFLVFMFAVSGICVLLNLAELNHLGWKKIKAAVQGVQARRKSVYEIRNKDMPKMSMPNFGRTQSSDSAYV